MSTPNPATTPWVPLWDLNGGARDLQYVGSWAAGTYYDGQIVVYRGIAYLCVRTTTAAPVPWPISGGPPTYGTTLPTNPVDGQEAILVDSVTNPSYTWRFRYNAGSTSTYKWEFIGGAPWFTKADAAATLPSTSAWHLTATSIAFGPLRAGDYYAETTVQVNGPTALGLWQIGLASNVGVPQSQAQARSVAAASTWDIMTHSARLNGVASQPSGGYIAGCYWTDSAANNTVYNRTLTVWPVRVS